jgi:putative ABC transport system permease protein
MKRVVRSSDVRPDARRDVGDEIQFHLDMRTREFIEAGMSPDDARRAAANAFGDLSTMDAQLRVAHDAHIRGRDRGDRMRALGGDIVFALRTLRKNLGFTAATLATLALGIGATTSVLTVVNGVLLRPLPYADPSRLVMVWISSKTLGAELPLSAGFYLDAVQQSKALATTAAFRSWGYTITSGGEPEQVAGARVTPSLFAVLGVRPLLGRGLVDADAQEGASHVVVLGNDVWRRRFGADPTIIGKRIEMGGDPFTVVGVMPSGFAFPRGAELLAGMQFGARTELWTPMTFTARDTRNYGTLNIAGIARLKPGASAVQLQGALGRQLKAFLDANAPKLDFEYRLNNLQQQASQHVRRGLLLLMGAVALLLFIACANVTNLLLARTTARRREFAVRAALGAGRMRIARQLITENVLLTICGAGLGLVISLWATRAMLALVPGSMPRSDDITVDWRIALAVTALTLVVGMAFGLAATTEVGWSSLAGRLREDGVRSTGGRHDGRGRRALVVAEVSLSLMLVIGAALLTSSFMRLERIEPGFNPAGTLTANVALPLVGPFDPARDGPGWARFFRQLQERLAASPGIRSAGAVSALPLTDAAEGGATAIVGQPAPGPGQALHTQYLVIEGDYFRTMGIKLLGGRVFSSSDVATSTPVMIVNREYARKYLGGAALDHQLNAFFDFSNGAARTIVGVVDNVQNGTLDAAPEPQVYVPEQQMPYPALQIVIRTDGDPMAALPLLKREVKALDPRLAASHAQTIEHVFSESLARRRFSITLIAIFAVSALVLAMVGLYGVIALSVNQRRREIGVRMALGARPADVLRLVLNDGLRITAVGVAIGLLGAVAASRILTTLLFDVSPTNATIYAAATVSIVLMTLVATLIPARRATRVDPTLALRAGD